MIKKIILSALLLMLGTSFLKAQNEELENMKSVIVVPYLKKGESYRTVIDGDFDKRMAMSLVKDEFDKNGIETIDLVGALNESDFNKVVTSDNSSDFRAEMFGKMGADVVVEIEFSITTDNENKNVTVILKAYQASTASSLGDKVGKARGRSSFGVSTITEKAIALVANDFIQTIVEKYKNSKNKGQYVLIDITFGQNSAYNSRTEVGKDKFPLSKVIEDWVKLKAVKGKYNLGRVSLSQIQFNKVSLPINDDTGNNITPNSFGYEIISYLKTLGISSTVDVKSNTLYLTIN